MKSHCCVCNPVPTSKSMCDTHFALAKERAASYNLTLDAACDELYWMAREDAADEAADLDGAA